MSWFVYMVRCADGTLYTGITTDPARRLTEHNGTGKTGAKYTKVRRPVTLVYQKRCVDRSSAASAEAALKKLTRPQKLALIGQKG
jgi:putative endonuclease